MVFVAVPVAMGSHLSSIAGGLVSDVVVLRVLALDVGVLSSFVDCVVLLGSRRLLCVFPLMSVFLALVPGLSSAVGTWLLWRRSRSHIRFVLVIFLGSGVPFGLSVSQSSVLGIPFEVSVSQSSVLGVSLAHFGSILRSVRTGDASCRIHFHICLDGSIQVSCRVRIGPWLARMCWLTSLVVVLRCLRFWSPRFPSL